ncbi:MAG: hypothetical protein GX575_01285 [Candidatus Anammoximicrobium sp.]|nr:hypothetical protein [Candidatus Anammoximicrobium sp.]
MRLVVLLFSGTVTATLLAGGFASGRAAAQSGGEFEIRVTDEDTGQLIPVRMHLRDSRGKPVRPPKLSFWHDHFILPGKAVLALRPGTYTFEMERGPEYRIRTGNFEIRRGDADSREVTLQRFADMKQEGWWSGDLHVHRPVGEIELLMQAEDLHVAPVITWWNAANAWAATAPPTTLLKRFDQNRFYHLMAGEDRRGGGALLYFNGKQPLPIADAEREYPSSCHYLRLVPEDPHVHVAAEKPFWWDLPVWIAHGKIDSVGLCHSHMQRDGMSDDEAWGNPRDRLLFPTPHGNGLWTQAIYYRLLDCGLRIPPSAGSGSGVAPNPVGYNRVYVCCGKELTYEAWWENLKAGQVVVTNGPLIRNPRLNGKLPGHVFQADAGQSLSLEATLNLSVRDKVDYLEIVKDGKAVHQVRLQDWAKAGGQLPPVEFDRSGWILIRAVTGHPKTYRFASTGPWYVEIGNQRRISRKATQFFFDWVYERARRLELPVGEKRDAVIADHRAARDYWHRLLARANAD